MENASDGCVKNQDSSATLSKPQIDDSKPKPTVPYVNKPIFRRKLIEKYSTARYNINTKRVLVRNSSASQTQYNDKISKVSPKNASSLADNVEKPKISSASEPGSSNEVSIAALPPSCELAGGRSCSNSVKSSTESENVTSGTSISDETPGTVYSSSPPGARVPRITAKGSPDSPDSQLARRRKLASAPVSTCGSKTMWKIAPKSVYNQLSDLYQSAVEVKAEEEPEPEPEPKKETKIKRSKCLWTKKKTRRKPVVVQEPVVIETHPDPYIECLKEEDTRSPNTSRGQNGQKLGIVMYLGVNRPMFPLMYRNLRVLNDSKDATITDFWAEFALSTLVTKDADKKFKPILVPVKDPELAAMVLGCLEEAVPSNVSTVSKAEPANDRDMVESQVCVKQEENEDVPRKKRKYKPRQPKIPKTYGLRAKTCKRYADIESGKFSDDKSMIPTRGRPPVAKPSPSPSPTPTPRPIPPAPTPPTPPLLPPPALIAAPTPAPISTPTSAILSALTIVTSPTPSSTTCTTSTTSPARAPATAFTSPSGKPKSKSRAIRTNKPVLDEKALLKKFGYKECQVAIPKLSDTLIKYLSAGNYSNESAQLSDPTERELIEETDNFGLVQCTRTDGIIIDYVKRNRSLVYFYKLKKMLDFQKTNNKYFVCCDYMLIDRSPAGESDDIVDVSSIQEEDDDDDGCDEMNRTASTASTAAGYLRHSRNPNDLFKTSKISEWKNKSYRISWVKNHDLKFVSDVRWLLISLDKQVASLSHTSGCVLRYRLLFEIIYRAELSKKVICCEISSPSGGSAGGSDGDGGEKHTSTGTKTSVDKLAFGVYAFPGLCDKVLAGPYLFHEDHQFSASIRMNDGSSEPAHIRTLEEKENFPQTDDSTPVKHINAKWWSGKKTADPTEQYLNFFFNPSPATCVQLTDKLCLAKIIAAHPCHNYHSYEITGRESNLVLFHDRRTNHIERTVFTSIEPSTAIKTENKSDQAPKTAASVIPPPKSSRNLRKKPRRDYSRLVTDDMAVPAKTKNLEFHIVDVKSQRKRRNALHEAKLKRSRYHESPQTHIMNERMRRLEFRNRRNNLASVLEARPSSKSGGGSQSLVSILNQAKEIVTFLEIDNHKLDEEGKRLRLEQSALMRKLLALLRSHDINSAAYKKGVAFVASWKEIKADHRKKLIDILGQNFDKQKTNKTAESSRNGRVNVAEPTSIYRPVLNRPTRRPMLKKSPENKADQFELTERENQLSKEENTAQRSKFRKQNRQKMRNALRKRNNLLERSMTGSLECGISEEVVCENGKLSDPLGTNHILDRMGEVPIIVTSVPSKIDPYAVDPLANDSDDASNPPDGYSTCKKKEMSHPLYLEHSYCSAEDEPANKPSTAFDRRLPQIKSVFSQRSGYHPIRPFGNAYRAPVSSPMFSPYGYRPNRPIISSVTSLPQRKTIRTRMPVAAASPPPSFQVKVKKSKDENLGIDIMDNGRIFARLNIAKVNNGNDPNSLASSSCGAGAGSGAVAGGGVAGASTSNKIMSIIQKFLSQMEKASPSTEANDDERAKQAKRKHVVNSLKSFISKFESRRQPAKDTGYSSSRASNSNNSSPSYVADSIELESGYSSKSEESCDRDYESNTNEPAAAIRNPSTSDGPTIENIVLDIDDDDDDDLEIESQDLVRVQEQEQEPESESEPVEIHIPEPEEQVLRDDEFIAEEEEEEEIIGEEEFIEEEEEEEEIVGGGNTLEEMNDVDAAMRGDQIDCFEDSDDSTEGDAPLIIDDSTNIVVLDLENHQPDDEDQRSTLSKSTPEMFCATKDDVPSAMGDSTNVAVLDLENRRPRDEEERSMLPKSMPKVLYSTNQFTIIRSKNRFVPNIMKTPTKTVVDATSVSDHLSRIQVKPSVGFVKLSTASMQLTTSGVGPTRPSGSNDSIIKRLWYSPVTKADQENLKVLRRDSPLNESMKTGGLRSEKSADEDDDGEANSKDETGPSIEKDNSGANRILIKSFANHDKFKEAFVSNVDKLLNPEL